MSTSALRRAAYLPLFALVGLLALATVAPARAAGATLVQYGWWTEANYVNQLDTPGTNATPDVADMHVSIGPIVYDDPYSLQHDSKMGPTEVSAVMFQLPQAVPFDVDPATPVADVKLALDPGYAPAGTPVVLACKPLESWQPELAGNWNDRVYYQSGCSVGVTHDNGQTYVFTILASQLSNGGRIVDLAIAPTLDPNALPFKVWFVKPTAADLVPLPLPVNTSDLMSVPQDTSAETLPTTSSGYPATAFASVPPPQPAAPQPAAAAVPAAPATAPPALAPAVAHPVVDTAARVIAGILLLAVLMAMMSAVGVDLQKLVTPAGQVGGVGRFRRQRTGSPLPL